MYYFVDQLTELTSSLVITLLVSVSSLLSPLDPLTCVFLFWMTYDRFHLREFDPMRRPRAIYDLLFVEWSPPPCQSSHRSPHDEAVESDRPLWSNFWNQNLPRCGDKREDLNRPENENDEYDV
jgi:hypothetical protein